MLMWRRMESSHYGSVQSPSIRSRRVYTVQYFEHVEEMEWAIEVATSTPLPVAATMCIGPEGDMHGVSAGNCAVRMAKAGKRPRTRVRHYPRRLCRSAWVGFSSPSLYLSVCLFVCLFVRSITQKRMIQECSNLVWEWPWDTIEVILFWGSKVKGQGHRVNKCIFHTNIHSIAQKRMSVFKLDIGNDLGMGLGWKVKGQR